MASASVAQERASTVNPRAAAFAEIHRPQPLPFNSASLNGLSQRFIDSHWSNNYGGSVRARSEIKRRLADVLADRDLPPYVYNELKRQHLLRTGSVVLQELYFDNLGGNDRADDTARTGIASAFGEFDRWEAEFRRMANGLGGVPGWVFVGFDRQLARPRTIGWPTTCTSPR